MLELHFKGANWDEFREQHQHKSIKGPYLIPPCHFRANKVHIFVILITATHINAI